MKKRTKLIIAIAITMIVIMLLPTIYYAVCWQIYLINPNIVEHKEKAAVPHIIKLLKSSDKYRRDSAMRALAKIGDPRAIEPLMEIIKKGENNPDYHMALSALSDMRYEGAFPYVIKWAQREDGYRNGATTMLKKFAKPEGIPALEEIRDKLKDVKGDEWNVKFVEKEIPSIIEYINKINQ